MALGTVSPPSSSARGERPVASVDPRTGDVAEVVGEPTSPSAVHDIVGRAHEAGLAFAALAPAQRAALVDAAADALDARAETLVALADRESALGTARLTGELARTTAQLRLFAAVVREGSFLELTVDHPRADATPPVPDLRRMLMPVGVVAVFGASNFPFAFSAAGGDTASALAAGCGVVVKAHGAHPKLDVEVAQILAGVFAADGLHGLVGVVLGRSAGTALVDDPRVQAVGFTGSEGAGRMLMDRAAARPQPIPVYAEMGSLNPLVVTPGALATTGPQALAEGVAGSVLLGHGQFCTKPGALLVPAGQPGDDLVSALADALAAAEQKPMLSAAIRDGFSDGVRSLQGAPQAEAILTGGAPSGPACAAAALTSITATDLLADTTGALLVETFGPASLVIRYRDEDELLAALLAVPPALTWTVHADAAAEAALARRLQSAGARRAGRILFGGFPTGVAVSWAQTHAGPYPAAAGLFTSVGTTAVRRFQRPVSFQTWPDVLLPSELQEANPLGLPRRVDGVLQPAP